MSKQLVTTARMIILAAMTFAFAGSAIADPCKTQGSKDAKELTFDFKDVNTIKGLAISFQLGLLPPEFPAADIAKITKPCSRRMMVPHLGFELFGDNDDTPPRWAKADPKDESILFVALMPRPEPARLWYEATKPSGAVGVSFKDGEWMYAVAIAAGSKRIIFAFYDELPDDDRLKALMQTMASTKARWLVSFDVTNGAVTPNSPP
jgi:hypothetical protein